ncbi:hypothetical protein P280DRAFT_283733 [Massarina eburnea CBS 473.64]|uniref:Uncharacterized protein n=1 Tax=Massarina eburnea CBS 473.64 TaxID=1395130 RepID=A0A6A6S1N7_9PLEO|nr:hypothetical protein P280DRAFT_283733 [Massarina eburnea CBS 473.64]
MHHFDSPCCTPQLKPLAARLADNMAVVETVIPVVRIIFCFVFCVDNARRLSGGRGGVRFADSSPHHRSCPSTSTPTTTPITTPMGATAVDCT